MTEPLAIKLEHFLDLKGGENSHLSAELLSMTNAEGKQIGKDVYSEAIDLGQKARLKGWTNIGDMSASLRTTVGLDVVYGDSETSHIAVSSKHTRPVALAKGKTQLEALKKALAGDINSPFGGFFGFNKPLEYETAQFLDKIFFEGIIAPEYETSAANLLKDNNLVKAHNNRFLIQTGKISFEDLNVLGYNLQPVVCGKFLKQDLEDVFDAEKECVVVTGNKGNHDVLSLGKKTVDDITFAGNAALYLGSNLVFYVHDGAVAGLGDGCGGRFIAADKARRMLEISVYAALSANDERTWKKILYDTPFTREEFEGAISMPLSLVAFSDAFYPKLDAFIDTVGLDRIRPEFESWEVEYIENRHGKVFIPKRENFNSHYDRALIPNIVVQPGGSLGDNQVLNMAANYGIKVVFTMTPEQFEKYTTTKKGTGRRFFGHIIM